MRIGSTPSHVFGVTIDTSLIKEVEITYAQSDKVILTKKMDDCTITDGLITTSLTQEDTFLFAPFQTVEIQLRILTTGGEVLTSGIIRTTAEKCLSDEVLA